MKGCGRLLVMLALAGLSSSAFAQAPPPGSYQQSCSEIRVYGTTLSAICRGEHGRTQQTALDIANCRGDIGNYNGQLQCNGGRAVAPPPVPSAPNYARPGYSTPGYPPSGYPPSGYPAPRYGEDRDHRERCEWLRHEAHELYRRLERTPYGEDHERLEHRLREVNYQRQECRHH
jgi:CVNH domain